MSESGGGIMRKMLKVLPGTMGRTMKGKNYKSKT
jgi:hypothetical protein